MSIIYIVSILKNNKGSIITFTILSVAMLVIGVIVCTRYVWQPLHILSTSSTTVQHREMNVPILSEINSFFVNGFYLEQEFEYDDSLHIVDVYLTHSACSDLPTVTNTRDYFYLLPLNTLPVYMLRGSLVTFSANASTHNSEYNTAFFYVIRTVDGDLDFNPHQKDGRYSIKVGLHSSNHSTLLKIPIDSDDYYSFQLRIPERVIILYTLSVTYKQVNISDVNNHSMLGTLNEDERIGTSIGFGTGRHCLFANIRKSADKTTSNYTSLRLHLDPRVDAGVGITLFVIFVSLIFSWIILYVVIRLLVNRFCKNRHYTQIE